MVIFPLAPDQIIAQMWSNGARGGITNEIMERIIWNKTHYSLTNVLNRTPQNSNTFLLNIYNYSRGIMSK